ncbi:response regulator of citrate/malate metabolism [Halobaculum sp. D14]|uniref:response regulator of citrate/malate metabolism n=1 Tax=Halobaculum sp. D14 TaxID=3421642 RepID=UPI003EBE1224
MARDRDEGGRYTEQVTLDSILDVFENADVPVLTPTEVAEILDCSRPSAYLKLDELAEKGELVKKKVGARAVVYIQLEEQRP